MTLVPAVLSRMPVATVFLKRVLQSCPALAVVKLSVPPVKVMLPPLPKAVALSATSVPPPIVVVPV